MKKLRTLTVNGEVYEISDPNAAKIDDDNIGADAWSSKNIVDRLCLSFSEKGVAVRCEPVEGYPLSITAENGSTAIYRCGKNLIDYTRAAARNATNVVNIIDNGVEWAAGSYYFTIPCKVKIGTAVVFSCVDAADAINGIVLYNSVTKAEVSSLIEKGHPSVARDDADTVRVYKRSASVSITSPIEITSIQLELGTAATAHEPYRGIESFAPNETVPALSGVNTIWADSGEITVTGKSDPVTIIEKLTNAIISLGGNV